MTQHYDIIIVGGGIAGFSAAKAILAATPGIRLLMLNAEDRLPYKRTSLSKHLAQGFEPDQFQLRSLDWYREQGVELWLNSVVTSIEPETKTLTLAPGERCAWDKLILATGAEPVSPDIPDMAADRMFVVRTAQQVEGFLNALTYTRSVAVVGMGVLGVEVAEQLRRLGKAVLLIGNQATLMPHHLNQRAADMLRALFEQHGVELRFQERSARITAQADGGCEISLRHAPCRVDRIVWCLGVRPRIALARQAGLAVNCGIVVNQYLQTSHPDIYAAGDVAEHPGGGVTQLWHAAEHQGLLAGLNAVGKTTPHAQPAFRLKCEVFDNFFFSIKKPAPDDMARYTLVEQQNAGVYLGVYYADDRVTGIVMVNDKARAKAYEQAARERWRRAEFEASPLARLKID